MGLVVEGSNRTVRQDEFVNTAAQKLFMGCAPERKNELVELWKKLDPTFQILDDEHKDGRLILDAGAYRYIRFNHRVARAFWIGAYVAWEGYRAVAECKDISHSDLERQKNLIGAFESMLNTDQADTEPLPDGVPEPGSYLDGEKFPQARAVAELATIALGWAFLHEIHHIECQQAGTSADPCADNPQSALHEEELSCDVFATEFLLNKIEHYSEMTSEDLELVRQKRELGIYFALFTLTLLAKDTWDSSETHPAVQTRINKIDALIGVNCDKLSRAMAHTAFATLQTHWPTAPGISICCP